MTRGPLNRVPLTNPYDSYELIVGKFIVGEIVVKTPYTNSLTIPTNQLRRADRVLGRQDLRQLIMVVT